MQKKENQECSGLLQRQESGGRINDKEYVRA